MLRRYKNSYSGKDNEVAVAMGFSFVAQSKFTPFSSSTASVISCSRVVAIFTCVKTCTRDADRLRKKTEGHTFFARPRLFLLPHTTLPVCKYKVAMLSRVVSRVRTSTRSVAVVRRFFPLFASFIFVQLAHEITLFVG
jgi:hypothetical protein